MYDHQTESLWLQVKRAAVTGPMTGARLKTYPSTITTWEKWRKRYPKTEVLSLDTGHRRDYKKDPYASYYKSQERVFTFWGKRPGTPEKSLIIGMEIGKKIRAYPLGLLRKKKTINDTLAGKKLELTFDTATDKVSVKTAGGETLAPIITYWFIWHGIHPETELFKEKKESP